jgi:hypothetical protein
MIAGAETTTWNPVSIPPGGSDPPVHTSAEKSRSPKYPAIIVASGKPNRKSAPMKTYGMLVADNGSAWYVSGAPAARWNDTVMHTLNQVHGSDFEVVDTTGFVNG